MPAQSGRTTAPAPGDDWFSDLFGFAETSYEEAQHWLRVVPSTSPEGSCMIESRANGARYSAGTFSTPSLAELRARGREAMKKMQPGTLKISNELGDVARKHTAVENRFATFQVASQFNCLEFVGPSVTPEEGVTKYICDRTQGPACSIACGPATVYRNYFAPVQSGVVPSSQKLQGIASKGQTRQSQIENLVDVSRVVGNVPNGKLYDVKGGYTLADSSKLRKLDKVLTQLTEEGKLDDVRAALRIGVHSNVQVTSCNWGSSRVADPEQVVTQVFGSACAVAYNHGADVRSWRNFASIILEASYEATLWAALLNSFQHEGKHGSRRVFLTCLGGGVFGNSMCWIVQAMRRAFEQFKDCDLDIRMVTYAGAVDSDLLSIEQDFAACISSKPEVEERQTGRMSVGKKRSRVEDMSEEEAVLPLAGDSTPSGKKADTAAESLLQSPPKTSDATYSAPSVKRPTKARARNVDKEAPRPTLDATVMRDAERLGYSGLLQNLAARPEVMAKGVTARVMLEALKESGGLVNPAKRAILGV